MIIVDHRERNNLNTSRTIRRRYVRKTLEDLSEIGHNADYSSSGRPSRSTLSRLLSAMGLDLR
jgi:response regulator of citrate/malate metabolism